MAIYDSTKLDKEDTLRLNEIAHSNKGKYFATLDEYYDLYGADPFWWILPLISRNKGYDDTFCTICILLLIIEKVSSGRFEKVVTDKEEIKDTLDILYRSGKINTPIELLVGSARKNPITEIKHFAIALFYKLYNAARAFFVERSLHSIVPESINLLIWGPLLLNKIKGGDYDDGYFPGLNSYYCERIHYYPYLIYNTNEKWREIADKVNSVNTYGFVHMREYLRWYDVFFYLKYRRYCGKLKKKDYYFGDYDISPIICASIDKELHRQGYSYALAHYKATKRLVESVQIRKMILWYEARPVDIAISLAIRDSGRDIKVVGYIGYPLAECMLGQIPLKSQVDNSVVPEVISVPGSVYEGVIKEFAPSQRTIISPAFRVNNQGIKKNKHDGFVLFLVLTYFPLINRSMIQIVNSYCRNSAGSNDIRVLVKMHPTFAGKKIREFYSDELFFEPEYSDANIYDCLKDADLAFVAASSASMDVILSGTYLICLCEKGQLYYTSIAPGIGRDRYSIIFDYDDFEMAVNRAVEFNTSEVRSELDREKYFLSTNKENFRVLLA